MSKYSSSLYVMAAKAGLVESGNKEDPFHQLIFGLTGKTSTNDLNFKEFKILEKELLNRGKITGMMTPAQQKYAIDLVYKLKKYDTTPSNATVKERLAGIVRRELKITASIKNPLAWVDSKNGSKLIEILKNYVMNAEKRYKRNQEEQNDH